MKKNKLFEEVVGKVEILRNGHAYLIIEGKDDLFINKKNLGTALDGDKVVAKISINNNKKGDDIQGVVSEIKERNKTEFSGVIEINKDKGFAFVRTTGGKMPVDFYVPMEQINGAKNGDVVVVQLHRWYKKDKSPSGIVKKVLGRADTHEAEMGVIMNKHNIDYTFPDEVIAESEAIPVEIPEKEILKRRDMRGITTICIDPSTARDKDDAISLEFFGDEFEVGVHISDVTFYVKPNSELAKEALKRGTSIYLVDRVISMFPSKLSNGICSLHPGQDKLALSAIFRFNKKGDIVSEWFGRTVVNISKDYSYEQAQCVIEKISNDRNMDDEAILFLNTLAQDIRKLRIKNDSLVISGKEPYFELNEDGVPIDVRFKIQKEANNLIEEFMLLANRKVDEFITKRNVTMVHRIHETPSNEKLEIISSFIKTIGFNANFNVKNIKKEINNLLIQVKDTPYEKMVNELVVRSMSKAKYSTLKIGHYGLGFEYYTHFTSPIRRFSDYLVHLILTKELGNDGYPKK